MAIRGINGYAVGYDSFEWAEEFFSYGKSCTFSVFDYSVNKKVNYTVEYRKNLVFPIALTSVSGVDVIKINSFNELLYDKLAAEIGRLRKNGKGNLIIDVRGCDSGSFENAEKALSLITGSDRLAGKLVSGDGATIKSYYTGKTGGGFNLAVLTNPDTSGAAEMFASVVKSENKSNMLLVGTQTMGDTALRESHEIFSPEAYAKIAKENPQAPVLVNKTGDISDTKPAGADVLGYVSVASNRFIGSDGSDAFEYGVEPDIIVVEPYTTHSVEPGQIKPLATLKSIRAEDRNIEVLFAKSILIYLGYELYDESTYFDLDFRIALMDFQRENGLSATGMLDRLTKAALNSAIEDIIVNNDRQLAAALKQVLGNSRDDTGVDGNRAGKAVGIVPDFRALPPGSAVAMRHGSVEALPPGSAVAMVGTANAAGRAVMVRTANLKALAAQSVSAAASKTGNSAGATPLTYKDAEMYITAVEKLISDQLTEGGFPDVDYIYENAVISIFDCADIYTELFTVDEEDDIINIVYGSLDGIGAYMAKIGDDIVIIEIFEGSGAQRAGLKPADIIVSIDGVNVDGANVDKVRDLIINSAGRRVELVVRRGSGGELIKLVVAKSQVHPRYVETRYLDEYGAGSAIAYLSLSGFNSYALNEFNAAVEEFKARGIKKVILDIRGNPGGDMTSVLAIARMLMPEGIIARVEFKPKSISNETYYSNLDVAPFELVTLIDGYSASASELLAGALKDNKVSMLVGNRTYGKARIQVVFDILSYSGYKKAVQFSDYSVDIGELSRKAQNSLTDEDFAGWAKITCGVYKTPLGFMIDKKGISPSKVVNVKSPQKLAELSLIKEMTLEYDIRAGDVDINIYYLEMLLTLAGYEMGIPDLVFDERTSQALAVFCEERGIAYSGVLDIKLQWEINKFIEQERRILDDQYATALSLISRAG
jgi:carboxyl-terminal processing protease